MLADGAAHRRPDGAGGRHAGLDRARWATRSSRRSTRASERGMASARRRAAPPTPAGRFFALLAFGVYSTHDVVVKFLGGSYSPFQIVFFAILFGFPLVTLMLMRDRVDGNLRPRHPWWTLLRTARRGDSTALRLLCLLGAADGADLCDDLRDAAAHHDARDPDPGRDGRLAARRLRSASGLIGVLVVLRPGATDADRRATSPRWRPRSSRRRRGDRAQDRPGGAQRGAAALSDGGELLVMGCSLPFVYQPMPAVASGRRRR